MRIPVGDAGNRIATPQRNPAGQANTQIAEALGKLGDEVQQGVMNKMMADQREQSALTDTEMLTRMKERQQNLSSVLQEVGDQNLTSRDEIKKSFNEKWGKFPVPAVSGMNAIQAKRYEQGNALLDGEAQNKLQALMTAGENQGVRNNIDSLYSIALKQATDGIDPVVAGAYVTDESIAAAGTRAYKDWPVTAATQTSAIYRAGIEAKKNSDLDAAEKMLATHKDKLRAPDYAAVQKTLTAERVIQDSQLIADVILAGSGEMPGRAFGTEGTAILNLPPEKGGANAGLPAMLAVIKNITDKDTRERTEALVRKGYADGEQAQRAHYSAVLEKAQDTVANEGSWTKIPSEDWQKIKPKDRAALMAGPIKVTDPDLVLELSDHPEKLTEDYVKANRFRLSNSDYISLLEKARSPNRDAKVIDASIDMTQFNDVLQQAGLSHLVSPKEEADKTSKVTLLGQLQRAIDAEQQDGKKLTLSRKREIALSLVKPVMVKAIESRFGFKSDSTMEVPFFQVKHLENVVVPQADRQWIVQELKKRGVTAPSEAEIRQAYIYKGSDE